MCFPGPTQAEFHLEVGHKLCLADKGPTPITAASGILVPEWCQEADLDQTSPERSAVGWEFLEEVFFNQG